MTARELQERLRAIGDKEHAALLQRFFKTGPGQYGQGDVFIGLRVPEIRAVARDYAALPLGQAEKLLHSKIHEDRLAALIILVDQARRGDDRTRKEIYDLYLRNTRYVNNWDLVDVSAPTVVGAYLEKRSHRPLYRLARSAWLWDRRISILATAWFIRLDQFDDTLTIAESLLGDGHDLMHKAVGWMLREVGKRDSAVLEDFLARHAATMPRTMLRYAIERLGPAKRAVFLAAGKTHHRGTQGPEGR